MPANSACQRLRGTNRTQQNAPRTTQNAYFRDKNLCSQRKAFSQRNPLFSHLRATEYWVPGICQQTLHLSDLAGQMKRNKAFGTRHKTSLCATKSLFRDQIPYLVVVEPQSTECLVTVSIQSISASRRFQSTNGAAVSPALRVYLIPCILHLYVTTISTLAGDTQDGNGGVCTPGEQRAVQAQTYQPGRGWRGKGQSRECTQHCLCSGRSVA